MLARARIQGSGADAHDDTTTGGVFGADTSDEEVTEVGVLVVAVPVPVPTPVSASAVVAGLVGVTGSVSSDDGVVISLLLGVVGSGVLVLTVVLTGVLVSS